MKTDRLNAFTDGVVAIIITIMVLELHVPKGADVKSLLPVLPVFGAYALSFINVGIYWSNHHHLLQAARKVSGAVLWANLHLLFWLSLIPFLIRWIGEEGISAWPVAAYGLVMVMAAVAYMVLERALEHADPESPVREALEGRGKEMVSLALYVAGMVAAAFSAWVSVLCYSVVSMMWLIPDRRFERRA